MGRTVKEMEGRVGEDKKYKYKLGALRNELYFLFCVKEEFVYSS